MGLFKVGDAVVLNYRDSHGIGWARFNGSIGIITHIYGSGGCVIEWESGAASVTGGGSGSSTESPENLLLSFTIMEY